MAEGGLRIDKFLWFARFARTRSAAQAIVEDGHLRIDGRVVDRAHAPVRVGSVIGFPLHDRVRIVRVLRLPARRGAAPEAQACYEDLSPAPAGAQPRSGQEA